MPAPASKAAWRLLAACAIANAVSLSSPALAQSAATRADAPPHAQSAERQDSFYCEERRLGYWFYCDRPKPPENRMSPRLRQARPANLTQSRRHCGN
jgi:conjugal transfer pilus assembly protein TraF